MKFNFVANGTHYIDHMLPIWEKLPQSKRGYFYIHNKTLDYVRGKNIVNLNTYCNGYFLKQKITQDNKKHDDLFTLVASYRDIDYVDIGKKNIILMEHGAGQIYQTENQAWNRTYNNPNLILLLATNEILAKRFRENNNIPVEIVGCPKLDQYIQEYPKTENIGISFHFDCKALPETRSSWEYYRDILPQITNLKGHWHPVWGDQLEKWYSNRGISYYKNFENIIKNTDLYICDNSSTIFEYAAIGKPVLLLNNPNYRKDIEHGMRFWEFSDIGYQVNNSEELLNTIPLALKDSKKQKKRREEISNIVYPYRGNAINKFIEVILNFK